MSPKNVRQKLRSLVERTLPLFEWLEKIWNSWPIAAVLCAAGIGAAIWAISASPLPGVSIGLLAFAAGIMSIRPEMKLLEKLCWVIILSCFLSVEVHSIRKDRAESQKQAADDRRDQDKNFGNVLSAQQSAFNATASSLKDEYKLSEKQFTATMRRFSSNETSSQARFDKIIDHGEKLAESLSGQLIPGHEPTPANICRDIPSNATLVFLGSSSQQIVNVITSLPSVVLAQSKNLSRDSPGHSVAFGANPASYTPVLSLERSANGAPVVVLDMRGKDKKIIARLNTDGFVINRNDILKAERTDSKLVLIDEFGDEALRVEYLNQHAIAVSGKGVGYGAGIEGMCSLNAGPAIISPAP